MIHRSQRSSRAESSLAQQFAVLDSASRNIRPSSFLQGYNGTIDDGFPDLAVANCGSGTITILLGHGDGTFHAVAPNLTTAQPPGTLVTADFNGDGMPDLAAVCVPPSMSASPSLTILLGNGDGPSKR